MSVQYIRGTTADRAAIIDFINYVFSQADRPHDFKTLLPKAYADNEAGTENWHFIAKAEDGIKGCVSDRPTPLAFGKDVLRCGFVGSVSVHKYARREGHMITLMNMLIEDAKEQGYDMLVLGGQRQRYGYFGFEHGGLALGFTVDSSNIRHMCKNADPSRVEFVELSEDCPEKIDFAKALLEKKLYHGIRTREEFLDVVKSWTAGAYLILLDGEPFGYLSENLNELVLTDESELPLVLKAWMEERELRNIHLSCAPWDTERVAILRDLCENMELNQPEMVHVLRWKRVLEVLLPMKALYTRLEDGSAVIAVDGETLRVTVENGVPRVEETEDAPDYTAEHRAAERFMLGLETLVTPDARFHNWFPLPFFIGGQDTF